MSLTASCDCVDREGLYALVRGSLVRLDFHRVGKASKGLVKHYPET